MRVRIKVNITSVVAEMDRRRQTYTTAIKNKMAEVGCDYHTAKKTVEKELKYKSFARAMSNI